MKRQALLLIALICLLAGCETEHKVTVVSNGDEFSVKLDGVLSSKSFKTYEEASCYGGKWVTAYEEQERHEKKEWRPVGR